MIILPLMLIAASQINGDTFSVQHDRLPSKAQADYRVECGNKQLAITISTTNRQKVTLVGLLYEHRSYREADQGYKLSNELSKFRNSKIESVTCGIKQGEFVVFIDGIVAAASMQQEEFTSRQLVLSFR